MLVKVLPVCADDIPMVSECEFSNHQPVGITIITAVPRKATAKLSFLRITKHPARSLRAASAARAKKGFQMKQAGDFGRKFWLGVVESGGFKGTQEPRIIQRGGGDIGNKQGVLVHGVVD